MSKNIKIVNKSNFDSEVLKSDKPVLVDFWAAWCGPCRMVSPVIDQLADEYERKIEIAKVNVDENPELAARYEIMSIPSVFLFNKGSKVDGIIGARPKQAFDDMLKKHI
ncbi:MAG: thioredoxin [Gracilibacteraceae bacterium]|nr:thioredoxin [Gracilibacteraceae bacterium]